MRRLRSSSVPRWQRESQAHNAHACPPCGCPRYLRKRRARIGTRPLRFRRTDARPQAADPAFLVRSAVLKSRHAPASRTAFASCWREVSRAPVAAWAPRRFRAAVRRLPKAIAGAPSRCGLQCKAWVSEREADAYTLAARMSREAQAVTGAKKPATHRGDFEPLCAGCRKRSLGHPAVAGFDATPGSASARQMRTCLRLA